MLFLQKLFQRKRPSANSKRLRSGARPQSSLRRGSSRNKPGLPSLPSELVLYILEIAAANSPNTACEFAVLCKATCERARIALYARPVLSSARQINLFIKTIKKSAALAARVEGLVLDGANAGTDDGGRVRGAVTTRLPTILEICLRLKNLELRTAIVFSLTDFANANALLHVTLDGCLLSDRTTTQRYHPFFTTLPAVETLTLRHAQFDASTADHFLCPKTLPKVVALTLEGCRLVDDPANLNDGGVYEPRHLAAQLEFLSITEDADRSSSEHFVPDLVAQCSSLRSLSIDVAHLTAHVLERLPLTLTHLSLVAPPLPSPDLFDPHLSAAHALSTSFLALAALSSTSSHSTPFGTWDSSARSPLSTSSTPISTPLTLSRFGTPAPSPPSGATPLSELVSLSLPDSWDLASRSSWGKNGEFAWAVGRIARECGRREVDVDYVGRKRKQRDGKEMKDEVERVRRALEGDGVGAVVW
ncbi:hypothetical protein JCM21900_003467 [Sporobolomyces salmonicolor]